MEMAVEEDRVEMEDGVEATATADSQTGHQEASQQRVGATLGLDEEMALKLILHALEEKETPKFQMGLEALQQLKAAKQLQNYPLFCENVLLIKFIRFKVPEDLLEALEAAAASPFHPQQSSDPLPRQPAQRSSSTTTTTTTETQEPRFYSRYSATRQGRVVHTTLHKTSTTPDGRPKRVREYSKHDLHISTILMFLSYRTYMYLRSSGILHLPAPSLIRRHIQHYQFRYGHQEEPFILLKEKLQRLKDPRDRCVDIIFDEIHLEVN